MSENRINDIRDISELRVLPTLAHLYLADPDYAPNPLALFPGCDYFVLFFLPKLQSLNGAPVPTSIIQETIPAFINRRKLFLLYRALTEARVQHETVTSACINRPSVSQSVRDALRLVAKAVRLGIADVRLICNTSIPFSLKFFEKLDEFVSALRMIREAERESILALSLSSTQVCSFMTTVLTYLALI